MTLDEIDKDPTKRAEFLRYLLAEREACYKYAKERFDALPDPLSDMELISIDLAGRYRRSI